MADGSPQRVAVIGGGAIGGYLAAEAVAAGHDVTLCVRGAIERLILVRAGRPREIDLRIATEPSEMEPFPWVILATKAQDTAGAAPWLRQLVGRNTIVVAAQNGVGHEERVAPFAGGAAIVPALVYTAVERVAPGRVVHHVGNRIVVPDTDAGRAFKALLAGADADIVPDPDFLAALWRKLFSNLVGNPVTALAERRMDVMREPGVIELARAILEEAVTVARAEGAKLGPGDVQAALDLIPTFSPEGGSSMYYDRIAKRPLEHAYITGAVVDAADRHGIAVPVNRTILTLLQALDTGLRRSRS